MTKIKSKKTMEREYDEMWKAMVKRRDNHTCQICRKKLHGRNCHAHHILPRQMKKLRWDIHNGITLCYNHHKVGVYSAHNNAIWFFGWMNENKLQQLKYLINKLKQFGKPI